ncbi:prominin-2-like isoform X2 [Pristis pectinata]|uniref:prominin-2-like isoform X2 n=1 Tax=Pristis pectinata TaxID=685728 RepID=UPI00223D68A6|nr:prominin-2-like isoform X2 [Pristis pectinata]
MGLHRGRMDSLIIVAGIFLIPHPIASQNCTTDTLQFENLPQHNFDRLDGDAGSIEPLYNMVNLYLDAVQPNDFPADIIQNTVKDQSYLTQNYQKVLRYEAGYLVSFILGVLYFLFMPLVGLFFCCCRLCGKCGGQVKERTQSTDCKRRTLAMFLLMTTIIILAGVACAFTANQNVTNVMEPSIVAFRKMLADVNSYIKNILEGIPKLIAQFSVPKNRIFSELDRVSGNLGFTVKDTLNPIVYPVLAMVSARIKDFNTVKGRLLNISAVNSSLAATQLQLSNELSNLQGDILATLNDPNCRGCRAAEGLANNLEVNFKYSLPTEDQNVFNSILSFSPAALNNSLEQASRSLNETPALVTSQTSSIFTDIKRTINGIERNLSSIVEKVQFPNSLQNLGQIVNSSKVVDVSNQVKEYDYYRWIVSIVLCCIILLIIACNMFGLSLGTAGIATRDDVYRGNACSKSGANFLMAGVGFSFIFSWLLILLVFVTFFVGGNVRTLVCKPWETGKIYQVIDDIAIQNNIFNLSSFFNSSFSYSTLFRHCEEGKSLWLTLPRNQISDLEKYLNVTTINNQAITTDLLALATNLENLSQNQINTTIANNFSQQAQKLREIESTLLNKMQQDQAQLNASFQYLASFAPTVQSLINNTIRSIDTAQEEIITTSQTVIKNVSECLTTKSLGYFTQYLQWIRTMIMDNFLSCQPAVILVNNICVILCDNITDPWNAFWFCLGWCTLFLIPSIIFAVKTAKHYRSIKDAGKSPEFSEMIQFKFPRVENSYGPPLPSAPSASTH